LERLKAYLQVIAGISSWGVILALWVLLWERQATLQSWISAGKLLGSLALVVFAITIYWVRHNLRIYRMKGPRRMSPVRQPRTDVDRLGRKVFWEWPEGREGALLSNYVIIDFDSQTKRYRPAEEHDQ